jgi:hypothetical protein
MPLEQPPAIDGDLGPGPDPSAPGVGPDPFARPGRDLDAQPLPDLPPDDESLFRRPGAVPDRGVEPPGTAPDPFAPATAPDPFAPATAPDALDPRPTDGTRSEAPPALAPPGAAPPATPAASRGRGSLDESARRTSREAPRRGLISGWFKGLRR